MARPKLLVYIKTIVFGIVIRGVKNLKEVTGI